MTTKDCPATPDFLKAIKCAESIINVSAKLMVGKKQTDKIFDSIEKMGNLLDKSPQHSLVTILCVKTLVSIVNADSFPREWRSTAAEKLVDRSNTSMPNERWRKVLSIIRSERFA